MKAWVLLTAIMSFSLKTKEIKIFFNEAKFVEGTP